MLLPDLLVLGLVGLLSFGLSYLGASVGLVFGQLRLPVLVYWLGSPVVGAATSMAISAVAALVGAGRHARAGRVDLRLMITIGVPSAACAWLSARVAPRLDPALVKLFIGLTLTITGLFMLWAIMRPPRPAESASSAESSGGEPRPEPRPETSGTASASMIAARPRVGAEIAVGASLGAVAGVVGLLLGTLRLPAMMRLGVHPAKAIGTNMAIGSVTGLFAGAAALTDGMVDLWAFGVITPATMIGAYWGASTTGKLDKATLRRLIAWTLVGVGVWMAAEPWW
ncbi:MAG: sulfite exporter TauE/SafE family protein [Myxococcales bacterium]|nr:sulfite exporter TauE/SafE family protein [Myxococcales bacterium]